MEVGDSGKGLKGVLEFLKGFIILKIYKGLVLVLVLEVGSSGLGGVKGREEVWGEAVCFEVRNKSL